MSQYINAETRILYARDSLVAALELAIPLWQDALKEQPYELLIRKAQLNGRIIAEMGDNVLFRSSKSGSKSFTRKTGKRKYTLSQCIHDRLLTHFVFNRLAESLAILSFLPAGVNFCGAHWACKHPDNIRGRRRKTTNNKVDAATFDVNKLDAALERDATPETITAVFDDELIANPKYSATDVKLVDKLEASLDREATAKTITACSKLRILATDSSARVRSAAAGNPALPNDLFASLARDDSGRVRSMAALNKSCPPTVLATLATDTSEFVRWHVAQNSACPPALLAVLVGDPDEFVRAAARTHPACPPEAATTPEKILAGGGTTGLSPQLQLL